MKKIAAYIILVLLILVVIELTVSPWSQYRALRDEAAAEFESFQILRSAESEADLREAVGDLGAFFSTADGEWVAIRYRDSHAWPGWSIAVAKDSGGKWWTSSEHFCGRFKSYRESSAVDWRRDSVADSQPIISALDSSRSLQDARQQLERLGFELSAFPTSE